MENRKFSQQLGARPLPIPLQIYCRSMGEKFQMFSSPQYLKVTKCSQITLIICHSLNRQEAEADNMKLQRIFLRVDRLTRFLLSVIGDTADTNSHFCWRVFLKRKLYTQIIWETLRAWLQSFPKERRSHQQRRTTGNKWIFASPKIQKSATKKIPPISSVDSFFCSPTKLLFHLLGCQS